MLKLTDQFHAARKVSVPLVVIRTADPAATMDSLKSAAVVEGSPAPLLKWDIAQGIAPLNDEGKDALAKMAGNDDLEALQDPSTALKAALRLPPQSVLFFLNAHRYLTNEPSGAVVTQAIWNLRDRLKADRRTWVGLCPDIQLPPELQQDVLVLDEPLPNPEQLKEIIEAQYKAAGMKEPEDGIMARAVDAVCGTAAFSAEQASAMCLTKNGLDIESLWQHKFQIIEQTKGLSVDRGIETFSDIGGLDQIKRFSTGLMGGAKPPRIVCRIEEIEKMMAGARGDLTGVSQDALQVILTEMEDQDYAGIIAVGPPGSGKSLYSKSLGKTFGIPAITLDLGAAKGSLVGESESFIRAVMKTVRTIGGKGGAFFVATSNKLDIVPPELRRRFRFGIWYWDLPTDEERKSIWKINLKKYDLNGKGHKLPNDADWTGADIRSVCEIAWRLNCSLLDASGYIVPVAKSDPQGIENLRTIANQRYLSASYPGTYKKPQEREQELPKGRAIATA